MAASAKEEPAWQTKLSPKCKIVKKESSLSVANKKKREKEEREQKKKNRKQVLPVHSNGGLSQKRGARTADEMLGKK